MAGQTILVAEDDPGIRLVVSQTLTDAGYTVRATGSADALQRWVKNGEGDVVVCDVHMGDTAIFDLMPALRMERPDLPFVVMSGNNTIATAASAAEHGAFDYLPKPFDIEVLTDIVARAARKPSAAKRLERGTKAGDMLALPLIGRSEPMQDVYRVISRVMNTDLPVLIQGEAGTGKDLAARALHELGARRGEPFVAVDLAAAPPERAHVELFGRDGQGGLSQAKAGALYLDEVGELSPQAQAQALRLLRETAGVRIIASSRHDLAELAEQGRFREDLLHRLDVVRLSMPPLRRRKEDIPELARAFLARAAQRGLPEKTFDPSAIDLLAIYHWPGNVRELENLVHRLAALTADPVIAPKDVEREIRSGLTAGEGPEAGFESEVQPLLQKHVMGELLAAAEEDGADVHSQVMSRVERPLIAMALSLTSGNKVRAAAMLGLNRNTLRAKINALGIADD